MTLMAEWQRTANCFYNLGCLELRQNTETGNVELRNSTEPDKVVSFSAEEWLTVEAMIRRGDLHLRPI